MVTTGSPPARTAVPPSGSTLDDVVGTEATGRGRFGRRVAVAAMTLLVLAGLSGLLGVRSATATASSGPWTMTVTYPQVARAGLDVPFRVDLVSAAGPVAQPVTLAFENHYLDVFEHQDLRPDPDSAVAAPRFAYYTFAAPPGPAFRASFDVYVQPSAQLPVSTDVVAVVGGQEVARVRVRTWLAP